MGVQLSDECIEQVLSHSQQALRRFVTDAGTMKLPVSALIVTGIRPQPASRVERSGL